MPVRLGIWAGGNVEGSDAGDDIVHRRPQLGAGRPGRVQRDQSGGGGAQVAPGIAQHAFDDPHRAGRRIVGGEVANQLGCQKLVGRRMVRQERQGSDSAGFAGRERTVQHGLHAGFPGERAVAKAGRVGLQVDGPAGQDIGERSDIGLRVAGQRADGVQFQALAGQIFVQAAMGLQANAAVGTDGSGIVQIQQHRGVAHRGQQHVTEAAGDVRADGFFHEGGGDRGAGCAPGRDGEVVGPKPDQPFAERGGGDDRVCQLAVCLGPEQSARSGFARRWLGHAIFTQGGETGGGGRGIVEAGWIRLLYLVQQPCGGIGRQRFPAPPAQAKPDESHGCSCVHIRLSSGPAGVGL